MKRLLPALALAAALALAGCGNTAAGASDASVSQTTGGAARFSVYDSDGDEHKAAGVTYCTYVVQDNQTGVRYLYFKCGYGGGMTPLLRADGTPDTDPEAGL